MAQSGAEPSNFTLSIVVKLLGVVGCVCVCVTVCVSVCACVHMLAHFRLFRRLARDAAVCCVQLRMWGKRKKLDKAFDTVRSHAEARCICCLVRSCASRALKGPFLTEAESLQLDSKLCTCEHLSLRAAESLCEDADVTGAHLSEV